MMPREPGDPEGCSEIFMCGGIVGSATVRGWKFRFGIASDEVFYADRELARGAAQAWHDRRRQLVDRLETEGVQLDMWPAALRWAESDCLDCEAWLSRGPAWTADDFPAVLRKFREPT